VTEFGSSEGLSQSREGAKSGRDGAPREPVETGALGTDARAIGSSEGLSPSREGAKSGRDGASHEPVEAGALGTDARASGSSEGLSRSREGAKIERAGASRESAEPAASRPDAGVGHPVAPLRVSAPLRENFPQPSRPLIALGLAAASTLLAVGVVAPVLATSTERFVLDDAAALAAGELENTAVHSDGRVTIGVGVEPIALPDDVALVYATARASDGTVYLGTGNEGRVYRVRDGQVEQHADTDQLVVSSLAMGGGGTLYAGTLPEGRIYTIGADGAVNELARPDDVEHIWDLAYDASRDRLYAATGPEGRVYQIDRAGRATILWDSSASHVMSLALGADGALYAGTSDDAVVVRIEGPDRVEVVHDFEGNEITALAFRDGVLAVGANEFPDPPNVTSAHAKVPSGASASPPRPRPGKGRIYRVGADGRAERVFAQDEGHITSLSILDDGRIVAGTGAEGRVVQVNPDRTTSTIVDVDERQVLDVRFDVDDPYFVTGDGAAFYRVSAARPTNPAWVSKVLDARFTARWGQLDWRGEGRLALQTRTGNTEEPDETWSDWSTDLTDSGPVRSPQARFLQIRARFDRDPDAVLRAVTVYFLPQNQRAYVTDVGLEGANKAATTKMRAERQSEVPDASTTYKIAWEVENPDDDRLRYRLRFRRDGQTIWRDILPSDTVLTGDDYEWETEAIPDGWYIVRVEASDELDNPDALVLRDTRDSEPIRIDNHAPRVTELRFAGTRLTGRAIDALGPITRLEYAVDGGDWRAVFPVDDLFDTENERFEIDLSSLDPGTHIVAVRATDAGGNSASSEAQIRR